MLPGLGPALQKDLRLLLRDRAGLVFLTIAPLVVITVAGFSLASLYGADPRGTSAYALPFADEDAGAVGRAVRERLAGETAVRLSPVANAADARALVHAQRAGVALAIPRGTSEALAAGRTAPLLFFTDPVKYLEIANVRALVQELRHGVERAAGERAAEALRAAEASAGSARRDFTQATVTLKQELEALATHLATVRREAEQRATTARRNAERQLRTLAATERATVRARLTAELAPLRTLLADLERTERKFAAWMQTARARAGRFADRIPPPPTPPVVPPALAALAALDADTLAARLLPPTPASIELPQLELPPAPVLPALSLPDLPELPSISLPGTLDIEEISATGAPRRLNTFDQNVPGFSVTFLLLGMLLGVSLGLLDERDWGTLERLRALPTPFATVLIAKLLARFGVGVAQMVVLLAVGRLAFGVSLGPQPWALLLPTVGIVFAATAFGLVVAGVTRSREAVLPVGSIVIVTMAAVGGCWWPIDLEPPWMRTAALAFPTTWAMAAFNDLMIRRRSIEAALAPTAVLLAYGALYAAIGLVLLRRHTRPEG